MFSVWEVGTGKEDNRLSLKLPSSEPRGMWQVCGGHTSGKSDTSI